MSPGACACGCGASLEGRRPNVRYASETCRRRGWEARHNIVGWQPRKASLNGNRKRKPDLRVGFTRAVEVATRIASPSLSDEDVRQAMAEALPPKARKHLEQEAA
jgi:hypothetical protein